MSSDYFPHIIKLFRYYKTMGENTFDQLSDAELFWKPNEVSNSIANIVCHMQGNMLSRWTDFLETDGEKTWRERDAEFEDTFMEREELIEKWNTGWTVLFGTLESLGEADLDRVVMIRNQPHTVTDAIERQLAHYAYHTGQIVYIGKWLAGARWRSLSIPKNQSGSYNQSKLEGPPSGQHFTDEFVK